MTSPRCRLNGARESRPAGPINLQENPSTTSAIRQTRLLRGRRNLQCVRGLGVFHGRLKIGHLIPQPREIEHTIDTGEDVIVGNELAQGSADEEFQLIALLAPKHRSPSLISR